MDKGTASGSGHAAAHDQRRRPSAQFNQMAGEAVRCAEDAVLCGQAEEAARARQEATEYRNEIAKYEAEKDTLYGAMGAV